MCAFGNGAEGFFGNFISSQTIRRNSVRSIGSIFQLALHRERAELAAVPHGNLSQPLTAPARDPVRADRGSEARRPPNVRGSQRGPVGSEQGRKVGRWRLRRWGGRGGCAHGRRPCLPARSAGSPRQVRRRGTEDKVRVPDPDRIVASHGLCRSPNLVSQNLPKPCVGSHRSVQQPLRLQSLVGSRLQRLQAFERISQLLECIAAILKPWAHDSLPGCLEQPIGFPVPRCECGPTECLRQRRR